MLHHDDTSTPLHPQRWTVNKEIPMKRILLLAAGALGTAGMIAMAAPASADAPANSGDGVAQLRQFVESQSGTFRDSIDPDKVGNEFLNGNCGENLDHCPAKDPNPGVLRQFDYFRQNLEKQSKTFGESINPSNQVGTFVKSITDPSASEG